MLSSLQSMSSGSASVAAGVLDSISAGILIYTATVELIAHEFLYNRLYLTCSWGKLWFSIISFGFGAGIMALLVRPSYFRWFSRFY